MMMNVLRIAGVLSLTVLTACGGGSKSGAGSAKSVEDVNFCIDYRVEVTSLGVLFNHDITNTCDFDVNIGLLGFGLDTGTIPAGQSVSLQGISLYADSPITFIACRPPSVPVDTNEGGSSTEEDLICFGG